MTVLFNQSKYGAKKDRRHPVVVPAAAVWDPRAPHPEPGRRSTYGAGVRTLRVEHGRRETIGCNVTVSGIASAHFVPRTAPFQAVGAVHNVSNRVAPLNPPPAGVGRQSSLGTLIVGSVFGLILVGGIIGGASLAGDNSPINGYSAGAEAVVSSSSAH